MPCLPKSIAPEASLLTTTSFVRNSGGGPEGGGRGGGSSVVSDGLGRPLNLLLLSLFAEAGLGLGRRLQVLAELALG